MRRFLLLSTIAWTLVCASALADDAGFARAIFGDPAYRFPAGTAVDSIESKAGAYRVLITLPAGMDRRETSHPTDLWADAIEHVGVTLKVPVSVFVRFGESGAYRPIGRAFDPPHPPPTKPNERRTKSGPVGHGQGQPAGFLSGKSVFLSPGHGWYWSGSSWLTQRGNTNGLVEDFSNGEAVLQFLVPYLWNAGAGVYTVRERDMNTDMDIADNADADVTTTGSWTTSTSTTGYYGSNYLVAPVANTPTATALFPADIAADGFHHVYVWYTHGANRAHDAHFIVRHADGETTVIQDMQVDGYTWKDLGLFYFRADDPIGRRSLVLTNAGTDSSKYVIADAVRFGGGIDEDSAKPRWEMTGMYYAPFMGCDECVTNTVTTMPNYVAWENEAWEDGIYISWHTNAPNPGTGTSTFAYGSGGWDSAFDGVPGSLELRDFIHEELIDDIRAGWDSDWGDRGTHTNWYGEINPNYNDETPGALVEIAFHDTPSDAADLLEPEFRRLAARSVYQAAVRWFADRDGVTPRFLPEPPETFAVTYDTEGAFLTWSAPPADGGGLAGDPATGYRVYFGVSGKGFGDAEDVATTGASMALPRADGLFYARVSATNDGGESFPTETLAFTSGDGPRVLVVNGYDRFDATNNTPESYYGGGTIERGTIDRINSFDYVIAHAEAIANAGVDLDSASNEAVIDGDIALDDYPAVVWIVGEDSYFDRTLDEDEQALLADYLDSGGRIFVSGSEIGWDLVALGDAADAAFFEDYLRADYVADSSGTGQVTPSLAGIFADVAPFTFDFEDYLIYAADWPDEIEAAGADGSTDMTYTGTGEGAAVVTDTGVFRVVFLGFPFETIHSATARDGVMAAALDFLLEGVTTTTTTTTTTTSGSTTTTTPGSTTTTTLPADDDTDDDVDDDADDDTDDDIDDDADDDLDDDMDDDADDDTDDDLDDDSVDDDQADDDAQAPGDDDSGGANGGCGC